MKNIRAIYFVGAVMALAGCTNQELSSDMTLSYTPKSISVGVNSVSFGAKDNLTATLPVKAVNTSWNISGEPEWVAVSPKQGDTSADVALTAQENKSADESRVGVLNFRASDFNVDKMISVSQSQAEVEIKPSTTSISAKAAASSEDVTVTANVEWAATCDDSWIVLNKSGNTLNVAWTENTGASRSTTVHLKRSSTDATIATIQVAQGEAGVTGSTETMTFDVNGEEKTYTFNAEVSWTATTSDASWLTVSPANGSSSTKQVKITALSNYQTNDRSGFVYIKIGTSTKLEIPVTQSGIKISASETTLSFVADGESKSMNITSNVAWQLLSTPEWVTVSPKTGSVGTTNVTFTAVKNNDSKLRTGKAKLSVVDGSNSFFEVTLSQEGISIGELPETLEFSSYETTQEVGIDTEASWTAITSSGNWISVSPAQQSGPGTLKITVTENTSEEERRGIVTVIVGTGRKEINIVQAGKTFTIDCTDQITSAMPTTIRVSITSGVNWVVSSDVDWLVPGKDSGMNDEFVIDVKYNPSINSRVGNITFTPDGVENVKLTFTQPGRTISVSAENITVTKKGGESQVIIVDACGDFIVKADDASDWITILRENGSNTFKLAFSAITEVLKSRTGKVNIELTGVPDGESTITKVINVTQDGNTFILDGFGDDENLD